MGKKKKGIAKAIELLAEAEETLDTVSGEVYAKLYTVSPESTRKLRQESDLFAYYAEIVRSVRALIELR